VVNSIHSTLRSGYYFSSLQDDKDGRCACGSEQDDDEDDAFHPQGNVVFACTHGWGFRIHRFADLYAQKTEEEQELIFCQ